VAVASFPELVLARRESPSRAIAAFAITLPFAIAAMGGAYAELWYAATLRESLSVSRGLAVVDQLLRGAADRPGLVLASCLPGALAMAFVAAARARRMHLVGVILVAAVATAACEAATWLALRGCGTAMPEIWLGNARATFALVIVLPIIDRVVDAIVKQETAAGSAKATSRRQELVALAIVIALAAVLGVTLRHARDGRARTVYSTTTDGFLAAQLVHDGAPDPDPRAAGLWKGLAEGFLDDVRTQTLLQRLYGDIRLTTTTAGSVYSNSYGLRGQNGSRLVIHIETIDQGYASLQVERSTSIDLQDSGPDPPFAHERAPIADDVLVLLAIQDWLNRNEPGWHVVVDDAKKTPPSDPAALDIIIKEAEKAGAAYFRERP
jgi:hypothetical protein